MPLASVGELERRSDFMGRLHPDLVVLTVIPEELKWACKALGIRDTRKTRAKTNSGTVYLIGAVRARRTRRDYSVALGCIGSAGNYNSAAATSEAISEYHPRVVLLMGIAAGIRGNVKIGDVVLSERVVAYESSAAIKEA